jgi:dephospho-CoA kinase
MTNFNHYRYSFENQFFQYLKNQISLDKMVENLYEYESKARQEYADKNGLNNDGTNEDLQAMGLCFRFFEDETTINTIQNLLAYLGVQNHNNRKNCIEDMKNAISLDTDFELQIYFA